MKKQGLFCLLALVLIAFWGCKPDNPDVDGVSLKIGGSTFNVVSASAKITNYTHPVWNSQNKRLEINAVSGAGGEFRIRLNDPLNPTNTNTFTTGDYFVPKDSATCVYSPDTACTEFTMVYSPNSTLDTYTDAITPGKFTLLEIDTVNKVISGVFYGSTFEFTSTGRTEYIISDGAITNLTYTSD